MKIGLKFMKKGLLIIILFLIVKTSLGQQFADLKGDYFGQTPPGDSAVVFAQGIISMDNRWEKKIVFSTDGTECYFQVHNPPDYKSKILFSVLKDNKWTEPVEVPFSINESMGSPFISNDGNKIYFISTETDFNGLDIYCTEKTGNDWSEPKVLPQPINSENKETSYFEADNTIYVTSNRSGGIGTGLDIWKITKETSQLLQAVNIGEKINTSSYDFSPCIAPDGSYIIFGSERNGRKGLAHLYICFKKTDGSWTEPINMNNAGVVININTAHHSDPVISSDGKYLFFKRHESFEIMDIYWVSTSIIDELKKIAFLISIKGNTDM